MLHRKNLKIKHRVRNEGKIEGGRGSQTNAIQLYANGPYWATMNLGATSSTDAGKYFSWGDVTGQTPSGSTFSTSFNWAHAPFNNGASRLRLIKANFPKAARGSEANPAGRTNGILFFCIFGY